MVLARLIYPCPVGSGVGRGAERTLGISFSYLSLRVKGGERENSKVPPNDWRDNHGRGRKGQGI